MKKLIESVSALAIIGAAGPLHAADAPRPNADESNTSEASASNDTLTEVIVTGTRQTGVRASDSAAPISIVDAGAMSRVGQPDLNQSLQQNLPSFNAQPFGYDAAALTVSAALRGLNPNDTLVLINGKRRHSTANLAVDNGSPYSGAASVDLGLIPVAAIDHVEVLQDGAAAQYGSDAIGGVINIILKNANEGGVASATGGQYYQNDGDTGSWSVNNGFALGDRGFVNVTVEQDYHAFSQRGGPDARYYTANGQLLPTVSALDAAGLPGALDSPNVNHQFGDPRYNLIKSFVNAGFNLNGGMQLYSIDSYAHRNASAYENYRAPDVLTGVTTTGETVVPFPNGFNPREAITEDDYSLSLGLRGDLGDWHWDISSTFGRDRDVVGTLDSANVDLFQTQQSASATPLTPQTNFADGSFTSSELTNNLDITRDFEVGLPKPLSVAFGGEFRRNTFAIAQGSPSSVFGFGAASYPGFQATDQGTHSRTNSAGYVDLAFSPVNEWKVDLAGRFEHYSDFGSAAVGKFTTRYDITPEFAVRGTVSNGFRAPTLAEEYYSATNVTPTSANVQLPANSPAAQVAGFRPLQPENSMNYSIGLVMHPVTRLQLTLDAYQIDIRHRIINSNTLLGSECSAPNDCTTVSQGVVDAIKAHGNNIDQNNLSYTSISIFSNGADTITRGVESTANYATDFGDFGHVDWSVGLNYNKTQIESLQPLPAQVTNAAALQTQLLGPASISGLVDATPRVKTVLGAYYTVGIASINLRDTIYGSTFETFSLDGTGNSYPGNPATVARIGTTSITDLELGLSITHAFKIAVGANNLFNKSPPGMPNVASRSAPFQPTPADGHHVLDFPLPFAPWGIDGGYYYGRLTYSF
jgi:iron complex outermembrane receptor protein